LQHITAATAHFKGFHDALGRIVGEILRGREKKNKRTEESWELFQAVLEDRAGVVENVGSGIQAIHTWHVRYITSDKEEYAARKLEDNGKYADFVLYIDRDSAAACSNVKAVTGSSKFHTAIGNDPNDDEHVVTSQAACACLPCRNFDTPSCRMPWFYGAYQHETVQYIGNTVGATNNKRASMLAEQEAFRKSLVPGQYVFVGIDNEKRDEGAEAGRPDQCWIGCVHSVRDVSSAGRRPRPFSRAPTPPPAETTGQSRRERQPQVGVLAADQEGRVGRALRPLSERRVCKEWRGVRTRGGREHGRARVREGARGCHPHVPHRVVPDQLGGHHERARRRQVSDGGGVASGHGEQEFVPLVSVKNRRAAEPACVV